MRHPVHLVNPMFNACGGSELHTISLFSELAEITDVDLWTEEAPDSRLMGRVPIRRIEPRPGGFPTGGNLVFLGTYFRIGGWIRASRPRRIVIVHNIDQPARIREAWYGLGALKLAPVDIAYVSASLAAKTPDLPGQVVDTPITVDLFQSGDRTGQPFTVGRHSRDVPEKHHPEDPVLYHALVQRGIGVRLLGGASLPDTGAERLREGTEEPIDFLRTLDAFLYRTHPNWFEARGRCVFEAMATGLPVVVSRNGGYAELIRDGENGLLAETTDDFLHAIARLRDDPDLRRRLGDAGRESVRELYGPANRARDLEFYTR